MYLKYLKLDERAMAPLLGSDESGWDLYALPGTSEIIQPHQTVEIRTGIALEIPIGFEGNVRGRSGLASNGIHVHIGTIESSYRGDIGIIITNTTNKPFPINRGDRIAQFTVKPVNNILMEESEVLSKTERGANGFGSSGIN